MMILSSDIAERVNRIVYWGVNVGIVGFAIGLVAESATIKRIFTPILGLTLLYAIYNHFIANPVEGTPVRSDTSPAMSD
jgi:predicted membrane protein